MDNNKGLNEINEVWKKVMTVRTAGRFIGKDMIHNIFDDFFELHGDRYYGDDAAIMGGIARLEGRVITVIAQNKNHKDLKTNYGMPLPEGYRKSLRLMKQAEKFGRPIITIIDTPGAYPGVEAEERGQAEAIARNLFTMSNIKVPIITLVIGEGGSGGALALSVANKIFMLENSIFSVVSPEGCASILWKDKKLAAKAAMHLKLTAANLYSMGIVDGIILEKEKHGDIYIEIKKCFAQALAEFDHKDPESIIRERRAKFRNIGNVYGEGT